ncbi:unnamed protein product [Polarella glacialis]|uniref:Uncharacterized protein n=1 Tax=Polarella glacialis TaxID=89957 RepID=A0A813IJW9_POLGL|nr:unnamed protein product [Polarella glacialis]
MPTGKILLEVRLLLHVRISHFQRQENTGGLLSQQAVGAFFRQLILNGSKRFLFRTRVLRLISLFNWEDVLSDGVCCVSPPSGSSFSGGRCVVFRGVALCGSFLVLVLPLFRFLPCCGFSLVRVVFSLLVFAFPFLWLLFGFLLCFLFLFFVFGFVFCWFFCFVALVFGLFCLLFGVGFVLFVLCCCPLSFVFVLALLSLFVCFCFCLGFLGAVFVLCFCLCLFLFLVLFVPCGVLCLLFVLLLLPFLFVLVLACLLLSFVGVVALLFWFSLVLPVLCVSFFSPSFLVSFLVSSFLRCGSSFSSFPNLHLCRDFPCLDFSSFFLSLVDFICVVPELQ